ncbi:MAG TPA: reactive intermediate/imine deaminase, partial [Alcanivorax sp.]|nr:reactive intermediate/imine deaminase [Alcanivorax sp.]
MSNRSVIKTDQAPAAIGPYSQAIKAGSTVYLSGQIPLDPATMELVGGGMDAQVRRVFDNLSAVCDAAGGALHDIVKLNIFLTDLSHFNQVNEIMKEYFQEPYPARAAIGVAAL